MKPFSICIIAKNEESNIERCLKSVQNFDCEIIVVDTGSTDRTKEIAGHIFRCIVHQPTDGVVNIAEGHVGFRNHTLRLD